MHVQRIQAGMAASAVTTTKNLTQKQETSKNMVNPFDEKSSSNASQIARNYFLAGQNLNVSFTGFPCTTGNFRVKELEDMPCTCCGRPMMTNRQIDKFVADAGNASGVELNKILDDNMNYFRAEEKAVVHYIQKQLKTNPDASLTTAITRSNTAADAAQILRDEQVDVILRTSEKSKELLGEGNAVQNACEKALNTSFGINKTRRDRTFSSFNRTGFLTNLVGLENKKGIEHAKMHKILDVAVQLPESQKAIQKILSGYVYAGNDSKFARRLIQKAVVTAEHIHPKSKGGPNATDNYMGECQECNGSRGNMSYDEWMKRYPNMPDNIQVNANAVTEEIIKGKIGGNYDDYPVDMKAAVEKETEGKVVIKVKNPEEIDKAREERGLPKPQADIKEKSGASGAYQGSYHGPNSTPSKKSEETVTKTEATSTSKKTNKSGKSGKSGKGHKSNKGQIIRFPSEAFQTEQCQEVQDEVA